MRHRKIGACLVIALASLFSSSEIMEQQVGVQIARELIDHESVPVVVMLRETAAPRTALEARAAEIISIRDRVLGRLAPGDFEIHHVWSAISGFAGGVTAAGLQKLAANPDVIQIDLDVGGGGALGQTSRLIGADLVRSMGITGQGVTVAVLDSGIARDHADLRDDNIAEHCFCRNANGTGCCPNGSTSQSGTGAAKDDSGHGTHVTGIITSAGLNAPRGIAPNAKIVSVKVLDHNGRFNASAQVVSGLDWIISSRPEVQVVNLSLVTDARFGGNCGGTTAYTRAFRDAINTLRARGVPVFAASGNDQSSKDMGAPGCVRDTISVGAVFDSDVGLVNVLGCKTKTGADVIACFSNASPTLDILAPGAPVRSAWLKNGSKTYYGTSQATAVASGAAALMLSVNPGLTAVEIENVLEQTGVPTADPRNGRVYPRIDVFNAVEEVSAPTP